MTNGKIHDAETDALLSGDNRAVDRYLVVGIQELSAAIGSLRAEVNEMHKACAERGATCPGRNPADPAIVPPQRTLSRETWLMWATGTGILKGALLPLLVTLAALVITGKL